MAIRLEPIRGPGQIARVYDGEPEGMDPFVATFVMEWEGARDVWIKGMHGGMTRRTLRELVLLLVDLGVRNVLALRGDGHVLPLAEGPDAQGVYRISVARLAERFAHAGASDWIDVSGRRAPACGFTPFDLAEGDDSIADVLDSPPLSPSGAT